MKFPWTKKEEHNYCRWCGSVMLGYTVVKYDPLYDRVTGEPLLDTTNILACSATRSYNHDGWQYYFNPQLWRVL